MVKRSHLVVAVSLAFAASGSLVGCDYLPGRGIPKTTTEYQAVFMQNGQVFFGKIENSGGNYVTLREVYYIQQQGNPETKEVKGVLLKRANELHAPDVMHINARQIAVIEPVTPDSRVAQLIRQAASPQGSPPKQ
jgi:hypothetical protein